MHIEYGPPGVSGVTSLQYLSGEETTEPSPLARWSRTVSVMAGVAWGLSFASRQPKGVRRRLAAGSIGAAILSVLVR